MSVQISEKLTKFFQAVLLSGKVQRVSVVLRSGLWDAFEPGQILEDLGGFQLVPPLVNARARKAIRELNSSWMEVKHVRYLP